jgi:hypothetical protein
LESSNLEIHSTLVEESTFWKKEKDDHGINGLSVCRRVRSGQSVQHWPIIRQRLLAYVIQV